MGVAVEEKRQKANASRAGAEEEAEGSGGPSRAVGRSLWGQAARVTVEAFWKRPGLGISVVVTCSQFEFMQSFVFPLPLSGHHCSGVRKQPRKSRLPCVVFRCVSCFCPPRSYLPGHGTPAFVISSHLCAGRC